MTGWELGPYRALDHTFVVRGHGAPVVHDRLAYALAPLADATVNPAMTYTVRDEGSDSSARYEIRAGERVLITTSSTVTAAGIVVWHVNGTLVKVDRGKHLILHAAGVRRDSVTVALPAPMESGKSTTCAGLLRAGWEYVTDEALVVDRSAGELVAYPKALSLDQGSRAALGAVPEPQYLNAASDDQWHVPWWDLGCPGVATGGRIDIVVMPAFQHGSETGLEELAPGDALMLLANSTFQFNRRPRANLDLLAELVETRPVFRLRIGELGEAVRLVSSVAEALGVTPVEAELVPAAIAR